MGMSRRQFTQEFKLAAVRRLEQGVSIGEVARGLEVKPNVLHRWRREFRQGPGNAFSRQWEATLVRRPDRGTGAQDRSASPGNRFFKGVLAAHRATADAAGVDWESALCRKVQEEVKAERGLTVERMAELARISRASYYRFDENAKPGFDSDMDLRDAIQRIALEWPAYGRRRITKELRRRGWTVNPKRVQRLMREDNLLCVRKRRFVVTTDSNHGRKVYPNLARQMVLTDVDQLWRADITYIRLREEFVFLAVILDAYSRRVIGWALDHTMEDDLTLSALRMALSQRVIAPGLVHHSDRGSQYASGDYTDLLKENGIEISMSRKANPWDNAACESFMKTLKYEEVYRNEYRDLAEARSEIREFIEKIYNRKRLHSALGYLPPAEFESNLAGQKEAAARQLMR
jgi:putative transposase